MHHDDEPGSPPPPRTVPRKKVTGDGTRGTGSTTRNAVGPRARARSDGGPGMGNLAPPTSSPTPQSHKTVPKRVTGGSQASQSPESPTKRPTRPQKRSRALPRATKQANRRTGNTKRAFNREELELEGDIPQGQTILLTEMAAFINQYFSKAAPINDFTPYDWWRRHKGGTLSTPLPKPVRMIGSGPLFRASDIAKWYKVYAANKGRWDSGG